MNQINGFLDFLLHERGEKVLINALPQTSIITNAAKGSDPYFDEKLIRTKVPLCTGDVVQYQGQSWLVISQIELSASGYQGKMRRCNHLTKFILDDWLYEFQSIVEMINLTIDKGQFINLAAGKLQCTLQAGELTNMLKINQRFIVSDAPWKIVGVDKTLLGLVILNTERDSIFGSDDMVNEIANADQLPAWSIQISNPTGKINKGTEYQFIATLHRNAAESPSAEFLWHSSNEDIVTVAGGKVCGVEKGIATISVCWVKHASIACSFSLEIKESVPDVITYRFYRSDLDGAKKQYTDFEILEESASLFGIEKYVNGVLAPQNDTYTFTLTPNGATSANYAYTVVDAYKVKIVNKEEYEKALGLAGKSNISGQVLSIGVKLGGLW